MATLARHHGHLHAIRFYQDSNSLAQLVTEFIGAGFARQLPAIVIATPEHRQAICARLRSQSFDVNRLQASGDLLLSDADQMLSAIMVDGMPDPARFHSVMLPVLQLASERRPGCVVRAYGEMVDVLWRAGETVAATRLETLWNRLAQTHAFALLCGYSMGNFYKDAMQQDICRHHSHVVTETGETIAVN